MPNMIFQTLIDQKIENFKRSFSEISVALFSSDGVLFHPAEFGSYREEALSELLRCVTPNTYDITNGFIITDDGNVSTQCDILIVSRNSITLFDKQIKFHPSETVAGIVEVKSMLDFQQFKFALRKMANNKMLFSSRYNPKTAFFADESLPFTYLLCKKINFNLNKIDNALLEEIYDGIPKRYWFNAVVSVDDGILEYAINAQHLKKFEPYIKKTAAGEWYASEFIIDSMNIYEDAQIKFEANNPTDQNEVLRGFAAMYAVYLPRIRLEKLKILKYLNCDADIFIDDLSFK